jgi:hypothetical protein
MSSRILFILKRRSDYNEHPSYSAGGISTGLLNSAQFVVDMLNDCGIEAKMEVVVDNNGIDKVVSEYKPTHVIIEALWVVPEKFTVLSQLHPTVKWIIRYHSQMPFIANEGVFTRWLFDYMKQPSVYLAANSPLFEQEIKQILHTGGYSKHEVNQRVGFLPNYYPTKKYVRPHREQEEYIDIGCFGAVRPLKNQLIQATSALQFAQEIGIPLRFHINIGRTEMKGDPVLNNLRGLFTNVADAGHQLVEHTWAPHEDFLSVVGEMDIGMQVSFSETFDIVAADMITAGIPVVMSQEIPWAVSGIAKPTVSEDITRELHSAWTFRCWNVRVNHWSLNRYTKKAKRIWCSAFGGDGF